MMVGKKEERKREGLKQSRLGLSQKVRDARVPRGLLATERRQESVVLTICNSETVQDH